MTAAENGRTLIRYKLSYPAADFVFDVATYSVSGVVGGLRPLRNVLRMRPLTSVADSVESFFNDLNIPHVTYSADYYVGWKGGEGQKITKGRQ